MTPTELVTKAAHAFIDKYVQIEGVNVFLIELFTMLKNSPDTSYMLIAYGDDTVIENASLEIDGEVIYINRSNVFGDAILAYTVMASKSMPPFNAEKNLSSLLYGNPTHILDEPFND